MRSTRSITWAVATALVAVMATGCSGTTNTVVPAADSISLNTTEPENVLIPGDTTDAGGSKILRTMFKGLVEFDPKTAAPHNAIADSIVTTDNTRFVITLKHGWTFHDGTPVTAHSFADAWNYTAYGPNKQQAAAFLNVIDGYDQVHPDAGDPTAQQLRGVVVNDDYTLTVTLNQAFPAFVTRLGYLAFSPLPQKFFTDKAGFEQHPIGDGPFEFVSHTQGKDLVVQRYDRYGGDHKPFIQQAEFRFDPTLDGAYADVVADKLDFLEVLPGSALVNGKYKQDLPGRYLVRAGSGLQSITFPLYDPKYADVRVRQAISMAVDRQHVVDTIFTGDRAPALSLVPPAVRGAVPGGQCAELCVYDPVKAKALFDSTSFQGPIQIESNVDTANQPWLTAVCASITAALGRDCSFVPVPTLATFRRSIDAGQLSAVYRTGWVADYPSIENYLNPLYRTGASSNTGRYSNPQVDAILARADAANPNDADALYQQAEKLILQDMPAVPLLVSGTQTGWSTRLRNVTVTPFRDLDLETVTVATN